MSPKAEAVRSEAEERMVRFGYYAGIVAEQWDKHPAADLLRDGGYDVAAVMREVADWSYGPGREAAQSAEVAPADLLRRALKNHDAIAAALRTGVGNRRLYKAIDDMRALKAEAADLGCYPTPGVPK